MKIEKINEQQIRCILTKQDLDERGLKLSELAYGSQAAKELFGELLEQAAENFDFDASDSPLMVEAIPLGKERLVLLITKVDDPEELDTRFAKFAPGLMGDNASPEEIFPENPFEELSDPADEFFAGAKDKLRHFVEQLSDPEFGKEKPVPAADAPAAKTKESVPLSKQLYRFADLRDLSNAAARVAEHFHETSIVYKDERNGGYLLYLEQGDLSREEYIRILNTVSEYGVPVTGLSLSPDYLGQHYDTLIPNQAIEKLALL